MSIVTACRYQSCSDPCERDLAICKPILNQVCCLLMGRTHGPSRRNTIRTKSYKSSFDSVSLEGRGSRTLLLWGLEAGLRNCLAHLCVGLCSDSMCPRTDKEQSVGLRVSPSHHSTCERKSRSARISAPSLHNTWGLEGDILKTDTSYPICKTSVFPIASNGAKNKHFLLNFYK